MEKYNRARDAFIIAKNNGSFGMKDSPNVWHKRAESFDQLQSYMIFARRMELSLRVALGAPIKGREGLGSVFADLVQAPTKFEQVKRQARVDITPLIEDYSLADCGAGTGSILSYIEWAGLPYPKQLVMIEPNIDYYQFLQKRVEGEAVTKTRERLSVVGKEYNKGHNEIQHVIYVVQDEQRKRQSQIQIIHAPAHEGKLPVSTKTDGIIFVGVSKYFTPKEFSRMILNAQDNCYGPNGGTTAFNTQAKRDLLPAKVSPIERGAYMGIKLLNQTVITGKPTAHHFYGREDLRNFPGKATVVHNGGSSIIVGLNN